MKNKCSNAILFIVVILPFTLFSYQNCSQLQSPDIVNLSSKINIYDREPLLLENLNKLNYTPSSNCGALSGELIFYHPDWNVCVIADDSCESNYLQESGYFLATAENCRRALNESEMAFNSFEAKSPEDLGYKVNPDSFCTQIVSTHVNLFTRVCSTATDGCKASYLNDLKFLPDEFGLCD